MQVEASKFAKKIYKTVLLVIKGSNNSASPILLTPAAPN